MSKDAAKGGSEAGGPQSSGATAAQGAGGDPALALDLQRLAHEEAEKVFHDEAEKAIHVETQKVLHETVDRFCNVFERASRRWEIIAYPSMFLILVMGVIGFYLIYTLSRDMRMVALRIDPDMNVHMAHLADSVGTLAERISSMTHTIDGMSQKIATMSSDMAVVAKKMDNMDHMVRLQSIDAQMKQMNQTIDTQMAQINQSMGIMMSHTDAMRWNFTHMNRNISKPLGFMNSFMPW